jgi:hypothetical protein
MLWFLAFLALPFACFLGFILWVVFKTRIFQGGVAVATLVGVLLMGVFNNTSLFPMAFVFGGGLVLVCYFLTTTFCRW